MGWDEPDILFNIQQYAYASVTKIIYDLEVTDDT